MGIITSSDLPLSIHILIIICVIVFYKLIKYYISKYFYNEFLWLIQRTIFRSYKILRFFFILFILIHIILGLYYLFSNYLLYGILILILTAYLLYSIITDLKKGKLNFKNNFEFHKFNTSVRYYNNQTKEYRQKSYQSVIEKIKCTKGNIHDDDESNRKLLKENLISQIDNILTFEYYDAKLNQSDSKQNTGTLFYFFFIKNMEEALNRIKIRTNEFEELSRDFPSINEFLFNIKLMDFNDKQGYHFNISLLDEELDKYIIENNPLRKNAGLLKFKGNEKEIYSLFEKYLELRYHKDNRLKTFKEQFAVFVNFFCIDNYYETPSIIDFEVEDVKYLIGFFSYLKRKNIATYKVPKLVYLILKVTGHSNDLNNSSYEQAHRNKKYILSNEHEKALNSRYARQFSNKS